MKATDKVGSRKTAARAEAGFTLIELIVIMIILGVLAVAILPRFASTEGFESRGFRDETVALLRYAQKSAVAQRRAVCVALNPGGAALTIDTDGNGSCDAALTLPMTPRGGSGLAGGGGGFNFLPSGATSVAAVPAITVTGASNIAVDAETGYVR